MKNLTVPVIFDEPDFALALGLEFGLELELDIGCDCAFDCEFEVGWPVEVADGLDDETASALGSEDRDCDLAGEGAVGMGVENGSSRSCSIPRARCMPFISLRCSSVMSDTTVPVRPARPVRPERCT